ncbi:MAG: hypothetical protein U0W24_23010 [Bacteroidales bacterium]
MKYLGLIIVIFIFSCYSDEERTFQFLNKGLEKASAHANLLNDKMLTDFESAIMINRKKNTPVKENVDKIRRGANQVFNSIQQNKNILLQKGIRVNRETDLFNCLSCYIHLIDSIFTNDSVIQAKIQFLLKYESMGISELNQLQLTLLYNKVNNISNLAYSKLYEKIAVKGNQFNKNEMVVIPQKRYLYKDQTYKSQILMIKTDTTSDFWTIVDNKKIKSLNGTAFFIDTNTKAPKIFNKNGKLQIESPVTGEILTFPFLLKYQVKFE